MNVLEILAIIYKGKYSQDKELCEKSVNIMKFLDGHKKSDTLVLPIDLKLDIIGGKDKYQVLDNFKYNFYFLLIL